ncbi:MAG: type II toxin-antitoxin system VapC family toxin [Candidatus Solibacter usitatus]|nr:type II toxin-antitoxin system VapC family toxin [Candidatus Solibacter usitatus]
MRVFIDSNIPMYVAGGEHPHRESARQFLAAVRDGRIDGCTSTEVLQEILYRYSALGRTSTASEVYDLFVEICPVVLSVTLAETDLARDLLLEVHGISARDAIHAAVMQNHDIHRIATFDAGFDGLPGLERLPL